MANAAGTFNISGTTAGATITTLNGVANSNVTLGAKTLTIANGSTTYAGIIGGTGGLTLTAGTETLSGTNTYTGATTINGGTLALSGAAGSIASSSQVNVANAAGTFSIAAGLDYKPTPDTMLGFALAGGGTGWGLSQGLGGGRSDVFQAGLYGSQQLGPWYLSDAVAFANYWMATSRIVSIPGTETLTANFIGQSWGGRAETGYKIAGAPFNLTPYAAFQA